MTATTLARAVFSFKCRKPISPSHLYVCKPVPCSRSHSHQLRNQYFQTKQHPYSLATRQYRVYHARRPWLYLQFSPVVWIIASNIGIFGLWQYAKEDYRTYGNPSWLNFMYHNFILNQQNVYNRPWSIIAASFSHYDLSHLAINMFVLHSFGSAIQSALGPVRFLALYTVSAFGTAVGSLVYSNRDSFLFKPPRAAHRDWLVFPNQLFSPALTRTKGSLGASGCVMGVSTVFACMYPFREIYLFLFMPVPAWFCIAGFMGYDFYQAYYHTNSGTDVAGHLGGGSAGCLFWILTIRNKMRWS